MKTNEQSVQIEQSWSTIAELDLEIKSFATNEQSVQTVKSLSTIAELDFKN